LAEADPVAKRGGEVIAGDDDGVAGHRMEVAHRRIQVLMGLYDQVDLLGLDHLVVEGIDANHGPSLETLQ
jgi:hypothetical protein